MTLSTPSEVYSSTCKFAWRALTEIRRHGSRDLPSDSVCESQQRAGSCFASLASRWKATSGEPPERKQRGCGRHNGRGACPKAQGSEVRLAATVSWTPASPETMLCFKNRRRVLAGTGPTDLPARLSCKRFEINKTDGRSPDPRRHDGEATRALRVEQGKKAEWGVRCREFFYAPCGTLCLRDSKSQVRW